MPADVRPDVAGDSLHVKSSDDGDSASLLHSYQLI